MWSSLWALLAGLAFAAQAPPIGKGVNLYSKAKEAALGARLAEEVRKNSRMVDRAAARDYIERISRELRAQSPLAGPTYTFEILAGSGSPTRDPSVLPGGYIFVPAGLFLASGSEAEFAGVLAHAMAHTAARHGTRMATRGDLSNQSSIPLVYMGGWSGIHGGRAVPLVFLSFLRAFELEADRIAVQAMAAAGYDPNALWRYIERMQPSDEGKVHSPLPSRETRIAALRQTIAELPPREYSSGPGEFERIREEVRALTEEPRRAPSLRRE